MTSPMCEDGHFECHSGTAGSSKVQNIPNGKGDSLKQSRSTKNQSKRISGRDEKTSQPQQSSDQLEMAVAIGLNAAEALFLAAGDRGISG